MEKSEYKMVEIQPSELRIETTRGHGKGGQHRNTTDSCVTIIHIPTGIKARCDGRDQHKNRADALVELNKRVNNFYQTRYDSEIVEGRREQIGKGECSEKKRTYRIKDGIVIDHITGKTAKIKDIYKGKIELLS